MHYPNGIALMTLTKLLHSNFVKSSAKTLTRAWRTCLFFEVSILQQGFEKSSLYPQAFLDSYVLLLLYFCIKETRRQHRTLFRACAWAIVKGQTEMHLAVAFSKDKFDTINKAHFCC